MYVIDRIVRCNKEGRNKWLLKLMDRVKELDR